MVTLRPLENEPSRWPRQWPFDNNDEEATVGLREERRQKTKRSEKKNKTEADEKVQVRKSSLPLIGTSGSGSLPSILYSLLMRKRRVGILHNKNKKRNCNFRSSPNTLSHTLERHLSL